jgi:hypothetical protein
MPKLINEPIGFVVAFPVFANFAPFIYTHFSLISPEL